MIITGKIYLCLLCTTFFLKVALEVLSYHNAASLEEVEEIIAQKDSILENDDDIAS